MTENDRQVGGTHYAAPYQHWDCVLRTGMGYLEGNATRYVTRWRKKGGLIDLQKAIHYVGKMQEYATEAAASGARLLRVPPISLHEVRAEVGAFAEANGLDALETQIVDAIATWQSLADLNEVPPLIRRLMGEGPIPAAKPVPLTEENHYSPRVGEPQDQE